MTMFSILRSKLPVLRASRVPATDLSIIAGLVGLDVIARILPHAPNFTPVAASALFAASVLRLRALSVLVPIAAMMLGDAALGFYDVRVMAVVYAALALPALAACVSRRFRAAAIVPILLASSLTFFLVTNFAVWAFSPIYAATLSGLLECYLAALPFLQNMLAGDLFWGLVLFGGYWLLQRRRDASAVVTAVSAA